MIGNFVDYINKVYRHRLGNLRSLEDMNYDLRLVNPYLKYAKALSEDEKIEISHKWGEIIPYLKRGYDFYRALKVLDRFSPDYLPASYYYPTVECALNPIPIKDALSHKSLSQLLYNGIVKFPHTVLRTFNGIYFDYLYHPITPKIASEILKSENDELLYKPAVSTCQGKDIKLLNQKEIVELADKIQRESVRTKIPEFVIQRVVQQSSETKIFNPSSLNCMRITTLNLNGEISVCSCAIKCGPANSIVDNIGTGKRGVAVGIKKDGSLYAHGFYGNGEKATSHNGVEFEGKRIKNFDKIIEKATELHSVNPVCKLIGWDLALDVGGDVVLIEGNTVCPSISFEQMATGPIFGSRTDEVIEYIKHQIN